jgi:hypothetical protein
VVTDRAQLQALSQVFEFAYHVAQAAAAIAVVGPAGTTPSTAPSSTSARPR